LRRHRTIRHLVACGSILVAIAGCGGGHANERHASIDDSMTFDEALDAGASILWLGAHPDDETVPGAILARACAGLGNPCTLVVFTRGDGGTCFIQSCPPDLGTFRAAEMEEAARRYGAALELYEFTNYPGSTTPVDVVRATWESEGDPLGVAVEAIRRLRPNILLSFDPSRGFTDHTEHELAGILTEEAAAHAADPAYVTPDQRPYRADRLYHIVNRYPGLELFIPPDDGPVTEKTSMKVPCPAAGTDCLSAGLEAADAHHSQWPFILGMQLGTLVWNEALLKRVDF